MIKTIDECFFQIQNGANIKQNDLQEGFPITRIETTANNKFNRNRMGYAGITDISKYESYVLEDEDLLMSHINSAQYLGRTVLYIKRPNETIIHGMNLLRLKANKRIINPAYARYYFNGNMFKKQIKNITKKSVNQASFSIKDLKRIQINVPNLEKQVIIVKILDKLQWIIERRKEQLNYLNDIIKARFVEMFGDPEQNDKGWEICILGEKCSVINGRAYNADELLDHGKYRVLRVGNFFTNGSWYYSNLELDEEKYCEEGDLLFAWSASFGPRIWHGDKVIYHYHIWKLAEYENYFNKHFFAEMLSYNCDVMKRATHGSTMLHFTKVQMENQKLILPPIELQNDFGFFVQQVNKSKFVPHSN